MENSQIEFEYVEIPSYIINYKEEERKYSNSNGKFEYRVGSEGIIVKLDQAFYIQNMEINANNIDLKKITISGEDIISKSLKQFHINKLDSEEGTHYKIDINTIIFEIRISYDGGWFNGNKIEIKGIRFHGIELKEIEKYIEPLSKIQTYKSEMEADIANQRKILQDEQARNQSEKVNLDMELSSITGLLNQKNAEFTILDQKLSKTKTEISEQEAIFQSKTEINEKLEETFNHKNKDLQDVESKSRQLNGENEKIAKEVVEQQSTLRKLKNESALYSNEYASFSIQGNKFIWAYGFLSLIPMGVIVLIVINLYNNTLSLIEIIGILTMSKVSDVVMLKMPSVFLSSAIITACYYLLKMLILKIMDIQTEKLSLSKISIIAQDAVNLSSAEYNLKPEQILEANIYLRMELLKNYMTKEIDRNYKYALRDQELMDNIITDSPIKRFFNFFKKQK
ncbi:hypothetical protein [Leptospira yasudae]|uniref:Uncharacterized protein n=1 Tax=Leptospira yasudae TaxID=2202201 RepID=A0ABX9LXD5_9LEPT|nr:hypothetical protein [Leptospira yasudae]RHX77525.1 hypothetical protein DLM77_20635 [Leptospira yasudae]